MVYTSVPSAMSFTTINDISLSNFYENSLLEQRGQTHIKVVYSQSEKSNVYDLIFQSRITKNSNSNNNSSQ